MMTHSGDIRFKVKSLGFIVEHLCSTIYFLLRCYTPAQKQE